MSTQQYNPTSWTTELEKKLRRMFPTASWDMLRAAFPDHSTDAIHRKAKRLGLERKQIPSIPPRDRLIAFLTRARTHKEIVDELGKEGLGELAKLASTPPEGLRLKEGRNHYQELTCYLERTPVKEVRVKDRIFTLTHSKNDRDYLSIFFPEDLDFTDDPKMNALRIWPIDSVHFGDYLCDTERFLSYLRYLEKPYSFAFLNGNIFGRHGYTKITAKERRDQLLRRLAPVAHKILWAQSGTTEGMLARVDGVEPLQDICNELGIHHTSRPVRADVYWKNPMKPIEFYAIHGRSNARKDGAKANAIIDIALSQNFPHFTILGRLKEGLVNTLTARRLDPIGFAIKEHPAITIICPGFQKYEGSEAEKKGYPPPAVGTVACIIRADNSHHASS